MDPNRDWLPVCHSRAGRTPAGALPGKFSAKLGMSPQQGKLPVERAPIQCPRARTRNGPHLDGDSGVRARELPGDQASGGDPGRGGGSLTQDSSMKSCLQACPESPQVTTARRKRRRRRLPQGTMSPATRK
ncbi:transmembrane protein 51 isoform X2 [Macaca fascicularis]|uniref:transmembrane protein 51 isoform X2 n=1 Tax=Macaca fascicularis TaxID=9541 RepID=UPI003D154618